jgi:hypothetical protein
MKREAGAFVPHSKTPFIFPETFSRSATSCRVKPGGGTGLAELLIPHYKAFVISQCRLQSVSNEVMPDYTVFVMPN